MNSAHDYARTHAARFREQLKELLRIPSISTQPEHAADVRRAGEWLAEDMRRVGFQKAELIQVTGRHPLVYGEWMGAGDKAPTMLVYCHYDVQPAAIADGWETNPFEPVERDGKIYARGAVDSKLHVMAHLKAAETLIASGSPINIKLLFEGEEESGSENITAFVPQNREKLKAAVCVISDGSMPDIQQPALVYGLRGIATMELEVFGPQRDLHSGHYGGNVHNPIQALAEIIAQLHNPDGSVSVPGFYDDVLPLSDEERAELAKAMVWVEPEWHQVAGAPQPWGEPQYTLLERAGARPTLEINGIAGGYYQPGFKTVLPAKALAKISCRLVPNQQPERISKLVRDYITRLAPPTVRIEMRDLEMGAPGVLIDPNNPAMRAVRGAYEKSWGRQPILTREGGSVPIVSEFQRHLDMPMAMMPFGHKGGRAHGPNEHIYVDMFHKGIDTVLYFAEALASKTAHES